MPDFFTGTLASILFAAVLVIVGIVVLTILIKIAWKVAEPNEALIISGRKVKEKASPDGSVAGADESMKFRIVTGSGVFVIPGIQTCRALKLNLVQTDLQVDCVTNQGIQVIIKASVIFKIGDTYPEIANAARRFLGQQEEMVPQVHSIFNGHLRAIVGNMTVEGLLSDREELRANVRAASGEEMANLGLKIDSMQILEIDDPTGYIANLAAPNIAAAEANARIARAERDQEATQREQTASVAVAEAQTVAAKRRSELQAEADTAQMTAAQAGPLADAEAKQKVVVAETRAAELQASLTAQRLETDVRKPADARAYETTVTANADRDAAIAAAEGEAQRTQLQAQADADAERVRGQAQADATKARGLAEAETVEAKGLAEAKAMDARADALAKGQDAIIGQQIAENLPAIVRELAAPFGQIDNLTVLNGADGMSQMVNGVAAQLPEILASLLGSVKTAPRQEPQPVGAADSDG
jgi:flotillin